MSSPLGRSAPHDSARLHVTGKAVYVDDMPGPHGTLYAVPVPAPHACARVLSRSKAAALRCPGVVAVYFHDDIPGENRIGPIVHDEPLLAEELVSFRGQAVALIIAETEAQAADVRAILADLEVTVAGASVEETQGATETQGRRTT